MGWTTATSGRAIVRAFALCIMVGSVIVCSCNRRQSVSPAPAAPQPDVEGEHDGATGKLYGPGNRHTGEKLEESEARSIVRREIDAYASRGYRYAPERSLVIQGSADRTSMEVTLLCMSNAADEDKDAVYIAGIEIDGRFGVAAARFSFERSPGGIGTTSIAPGVWLEALPACGGWSGNSRAGSIGRLPERFSWTQWWNCIASIAAASSGGCMLSCLPSLPEGYLVCYFTCVGGAVIAATIRCTIQELLAG
jgi:hypothetical protein